ncbi:hypothetical protein Dsin_016933 [Dipteronia sinensis]|uniref:Zinc finger PMZ-type domain-containing protein n=1 Tax=Dipteronia sinensis TaxID=43782 RepID=A0AAE0E677_9ROSI|nr:hypothetical protein Dsin_016933 [Dipteronia sinensis]
MAKLKASHHKVYDELLEVGIEKFSCAHSPKKRYHMMTTNIFESINSCLLAIRKLPITSIAEFIRGLLQRFKVDDKWNEAIVDLEQCSCSCREWDLDDLSSIHAMAVARIKGMPINVFCSNFFTTGWLQHAYAVNVNPVPKPETWDILDAVHDCIVLPWEIKK